MRLLVINPNTSSSITATIADAARAAACPDTEIVTATAPFGAAYIGTRSENVIAGHAVLTTLAPFAETGRADAALIAAFIDPGLSGARELMPFPVVGMAEAAMHTACLMASRFAIVTVIPRLVPVLKELAAGYGLASRLASVRAVERPPPGLARDPAAAAAALIEIAGASVDEDGAEAVVLGGAPLAGLVDRLAAELPVPVVDGIACGVAIAEVLVRLSPSKPARGSLAIPPHKEMVGLAPALEKLYRKPGASAGDAGRS